MKCAVHSEVDATGYCRNCGKALCPECTREVRGALYCEACLANMVSTSVTGAPPASTAAHPGIALALGFIPGLGAVYNGEYVKALIHVLIFGGLVAAQSSDVSGSYHAFLGIALACFYLYMPIEAYRVAKARQEGGTPPVFPEQLTSSASRRPVGAIILVAVGIFLLLANLDLLQWDWLGKVWPLGLIALGVWLLADRMRRSS
jgi:hypothetical protein